MTKEEKRQVVAQKAYTMLLKTGVDKFSLNTLLSEVSMSKGNFYHYFKDKYDLFYEVLAWKYAMLTFDYHTKKHEAKTFEAKVLNFFSLYLDEDEETQAFMKLMNDMYFLFSNEKNQNLYQFMQTIYAQSFLELESIFKDAIEEKQLKEEALNYVKAIIATADGMLMHSFMLKDFRIQKELSVYLHNVLNTFL